MQHNLRSTSVSTYTIICVYKKSNNECTTIERIVCTRCICLIHYSYKELLFRKTNFDWIRLGALGNSNVYIYPNTTCSFRTYKNAIWRAITPQPFKGLDPKKSPDNEHVWWLLKISVQSISIKFFQSLLDFLIVETFKKTLNIFWMKMFEWHRCANCKSVTWYIKTFEWQ